MGHVHQNDRSFHVLCGLDGFPRTYRNYYSLKTHFHTKHSTILERERQRVPQQEANQDLEENDNGEHNDDDCDAFNFEREVEQDGQMFWDF
jgi:hypothetical protein